MAADRVWLVHDVQAPRWRQRIVDALRDAGSDPDRSDAAGIAVHEALCNAHEHGHRGDHTRPVELRLTRSDAHRIAVTVVDRALGGPWSPPDVAGGEVHRPTVTERGRGLRLMHAGCDGLRITSGPGGTQVVMRFDIRC